MLFLAHNRQFIIDRVAHDLGEDWGFMALGNGWVLSYQKALQITHKPLADGTPVYLLGLALDCETGLDALASVKNQNVDQIIETSHRWMGRWVLITPQRVIGDAAGLLGIYLGYRDDGSALLSSSAALIARIIPGCVRHPRRVGWFGLSWYPPPSSPLANCVKLLPDSAFDFSQGQVVRLERGAPMRFTPLTTKARAEMLSDRIAHVLLVLSGRYEKMTLALTAGADSRILLSAALRAGIRLDLVTLTYHAMSEADRRLPIAIAKACGLTHRFIQPQKNDRAQRRALYEAHNFGANRDMDRNFFITGQYDWLKKDMILLRSHGLGLSRAYFHDKFSGLDWPMISQQPSLLAARFNDWVSRHVATADLARWVAWRNGAASIADWPDIFHRDQRMSGWLAAMEQGMDLLGGDSFQPVNSVDIHDLIMATPAEERRNGDLIRAALALAKAGLEDFPINPGVDSRTHFWAMKIERELRRLKCESGNWLRLKRAGWAPRWGIHPNSDL